MGPGSANQRPSAVAQKKKTCRHQTSSTVTQTRLPGFFPGQKQITRRPSLPPDACPSLSQSRAPARPLPIVLCRRGRLNLDVFFQTTLIMGKRQENLHSHAATCRAGRSVQRTARTAHGDATGRWTSDRLHIPTGTGGEGRNQRRRQGVAPWR